MSRLLVLALVLTASTASAQYTPRMVRLSFPNADAARHMGITWHADTATPQVVQYGAAAVSEAQITAVVSAPMAGGLGYVHSVTLANLAPDTTYQYRVGSGADGFAPASGAFNFTTAPADPCTAFTFVALGDTRGESYLSWLVNEGSRWPSVLDRVVADDPSFVLIAGDLVDSGSNLDEWNVFLNQGVQHYPYLPVMPSFGNHDRGGTGDTHNYEHLYTLPQNSAGNEQYYHFRYANLLVIAFNTEVAGTAGNFAEQKAWMEQVLIDNPATWKVVYFHHPVWTTTPGETQLGCLICGHPPNEKGQNPALIDLIDRYDIDLVVQSHNHFYERSAPMRGGGSHESGVEAASAFRGAAAGVRDGSGRVPGWGSLYLVTGGGGATPVPIAALRSLGQVWVPGQQAVNDKYHHVRIRVADLSLTVEEIEAPSGDVLDSVSITKLAQYRVNACAAAGPTDVDQDGHTSATDCNDGNSTIYPGAPEVCGDSIDQDCSGADLACPLDDSAPPGGDTGPGASTPDSVLHDRGCGCGAASGWAAVAALLLWRRRRRA